MLERGRAQLDAETVRVLEQNLRSIDAAIERVPQGARERPGERLSEQPPGSGASAQARPLPPRDGALRQVNRMLATALIIGAMLPGPNAPACPAADWALRPSNAQDGPSSQA